MSGQVATGWSVFPLNKNLIRENKIRVIGRGTAAEELNGVTIRVIAANSNWLDKSRGVAKRLMSALLEGQMRSYNNEDQLRAYAKRWKLNFDDVKSAPQDTPLSATTPLPVAGLDTINRIALESRKIKKLLTSAQLKELVHAWGDKPIK
jgi:ABC-type nitrate/sulfonate/bicarbonate transport system substrate-binding protein